VKEQRVPIAHHAVAKGRGRLVTIGLGSCVAITIHDPLTKIGGLAHVLLPDPIGATAAEHPAKFATTAVPLLLEEMRALGAKGPFIAKLAGGASLFGTLLSAGGSMGDRNIAAARAALIRARIDVKAEDVGGGAGRTVVLDVASGDMTVKSVQRGDRVI
jgi:chemotaxis protein CheD